MAPLAACAAGKTGRPGAQFRLVPPCPIRHPARACVEAL